MGKQIGIFSSQLFTKEFSMYTVQNFKTKKELRAAVSEGRKLSVFQPGPFGSNVSPNSKVYLEGPHYPQPHKWYATAVLDENCHIVSVK